MYRSFRVISTEPILFYLLYTVHDGHSMISSVFFFDQSKGKTRSVLSQQPLTFFLFFLRAHYFHHFSFLLDCSCTLYAVPFFHHLLTLKSFIVPVQAGVCYLGHHASRPASWRPSRMVHHSRRRSRTHVFLRTRFHVF